MEIKLSKENLEGKKLFIATPMYGGSCLGAYMKSCLDLQMAGLQYGIEVKFSFLFNESLIQRARNHLEELLVHYLLVLQTNIIKISQQQTFKV